MSPDPTYDENALLLRIAEGDEKAFEEIYNQFQGKLFSAATVLTRSPDLAKELVQDIFMKLWLKRKELGAIQSLSGYLFIMLRNEAYNWFSREDRRRKLLEKNLVAPDLPVSITEDHILSKETAEILEKGIRQLPAQQQQIFRMIRLQGMSRNEVAESMGIEANTVKTHLARAVKNLRAWIISQNIIFWIVTQFLFSYSL